MKKILAILSVVTVLTLGSPPPVYAFDGYLFNAIETNAVSVPKVVQVGADNTCELKVDSDVPSVAVVTIYSAVELDANGDLKNPAIWFQVTNPINGDPDNHLGGMCPNFVGGVITGWGTGKITVKLRSKR